MHKDDQSQADILRLDADPVKHRHKKKLLVLMLRAEIERLKIVNIQLLAVSRWVRTSASTSRIDGKLYVDDLAMKALDKAIDVAEGGA